MLFGQKLNGIGLAIYFSGIFLAVLALVYLSVKHRDINKAISFCVFAGIWLTGFLISLKFKKS